MENKKWGDYELLGILGKGSQGVVYKARQPLLDRLVAVKVLPAYLVTDESFVARFQREAQNIARLSHPNIVHVYDMNRHEGTYYYVMEYVEGEDLGNMMKRGVQFSWEQVIDITKQVASALDAAHEQSMVHRDIKPENILITPKGQVKVADFGLAKITSAASNVTREGMILGTVNYMSPEQAKGSECDIRSDLYSLGVVLFRLLTGRVPFKGENLHAIIYKHIHEPPPDPARLNPSVPPALAKVCLKLLEKDPNKRYQTPRELIRVLDSLKGRNLGTAVMDQEEVERLVKKDGGAGMVSPSSATVTIPGESPAARKRRAALLPLIVLFLLCAAAASAWYYDTNYNGSRWLAKLGFAPPAASPASSRSGTAALTRPPSPSASAAGTPVVGTSASAAPPSPTPPPVEAEVVFRLDPPESSVAVTKEGKPVPVPPSVDGVVSLKLQAGSYHVLVRAPDRLDREFDVVVQEDGKVLPQRELTVKLEFTPEKKVEMELAEGLNELFEKAGEEGYEKYVSFLERVRLESNRYEDNKVIRGILDRVQKKVDSFAARFLAEARDEFAKLAASLKDTPPAELGDVDFGRVRELLKRSVRCKETPEAEALAKETKRLESAVDALLTAVETARLARERNDPAGFGEAIAKLESFIKTYADFAPAAPLLAKANAALDDLRKRLSEEQLFAAWLARLKTAVAEVEKAVREGDFEKADAALDAARSVAASRPAKGGMNPALLEEAAALEKKLREDLPPVVAKGLRNRPKEVLARIEEFAGAVAARDMKRLASLCKDDASAGLGELAALFADECYDGCNLEPLPDSLRVADDAAELTALWTVRLRVPSPAGDETVTEKVALAVKLAYRDDGWYITAIRVLEPENEKAER